MSNVRQLFAAQKAARLGLNKQQKQQQQSSSPSTPSTATRRINHPLAKYDARTLRLTCAICGPAVPIKSDALWNVHLMSKPHSDAVARLRAMKEQMQQKEQQQQIAQGIKRKAAPGGGGGLGGLVAYGGDDSSEEDSDDEAAAVQKPITTTAAVSTPKSHGAASDPAPKRVKIQEPLLPDDNDDEVAAPAPVSYNGLPPDFFDDPQQQPSQPSAEHDGIDMPMEGVLPTGFFDNPEEDARVRSEVGGMTADLQQKQVDVELKALEAALAQDAEEAYERQAKTGGKKTTSATRAVTARGSHTTSSLSAKSTQKQQQQGEEYVTYEERVEVEDQELEESIRARAEEEYQLYLEMQERLEALQTKKSQLLATGGSSGEGNHSLSPFAISAGLPQKANSSTTITTSNKTRKKSVLELAREQEKARKEKERAAALAFAKELRSSNSSISSPRKDNNAMEEDNVNDEEDDEEDESDEDIEAMMDWRAQRV